MLISTFLNASLNQGVLLLGGSYFAFCLKQDPNVRFTVVFLFANIFQYWVMVSILFIFLLGPYKWHSPHCWKPHASFKPYTNGINGAIEGFCALEWRSLWRKCFVYFYWIWGLQKHLFYFKSRPQIKYL